MGFIVLIFLCYLLYRFGKWLTKFSKSLEKYSQTNDDYHEQLLNEVISENENGTNLSRVEELKKTQKELRQRQQIRRMIERDLDIKM